jgi:hypothetical protein
MKEELVINPERVEFLIFAFGMIEIQKLKCGAKDAIFKVTHPCLTAPRRQG